MRVKSLRALVAASICAMAGSWASAAPLYTENFDVDATSNWSFFSSIAGDTASDNLRGEANFFFDYSTVGIPSAPNSTGGSTRGLKLEANIPGTAVFSGVSVSPIGQSFTGDYVLRFDAWQNFNGAFPAGGSGSTQVTTGGIGTAGTSVQFPGSAIDSLTFGATGDGGSGNDYRAYLKTSVLSTDASGVYAAGNVAGVSNNSNAYYNVFGNVAAPAAQLGLFPQQTGNTNIGTQGMAWHAWEISKVGDIATWSIDGRVIASANVSALTLGGGNIHFGQFDVNATSSTDVNARSLLFGLIDNVRVDAVPEPGTVGLLAIAAGALGLRRRK